MRYLSNHQRVHNFFVNEFGNLITKTNTIMEPVTAKAPVMEEELVADFGVNFL